MRKTIIISFLFTPLLLANELKHDSYSNVKVGMSADKALTLLNNYQSEKVLYDEPDSCYYLTPITNLDGAQIMILQGVVERFDIDDQFSKVKTPEGIGIDSTKQEVHNAYQEVKTSEHPYMGDAGETLEVKLSNGNGIIFETYNDKVTSFRLGRYPAVLFIEGCA